MIRIETASFEQHSQTELSQLYNIVIKGYELTEKEIWGENYVRIFRPEYDALVRKGEVLLAKYNGNIAGGIHYYAISPTTYTFSLLASDFSLGGKGIGTALIKAVEDLAVQAGATHLKMEVLRVKGLDTDFKVRLHHFYESLGYHFTHAEDCICKIPLEKYKKLKAPSNFDFYSKAL